VKTHGGVEVQLHGILTSALDGGEWSTLCPSLFIPEERASHTLWIGGCMGPRTSPGMAAKRKKSLPLPEIKPWSSCLQNGHYTG